jgi:hypothetical protein
MLERKILKILSQDSLKTATFSWFLILNDSETRNKKTNTEMRKNLSQDKMQNLSAFLIPARPEVEL